MTDSLMVKFRSDESTTLKGFAISFKAVKLIETEKSEETTEIKISSNRTLFPGYIRNTFSSKSSRIFRKGGGVSKRKDSKSLKTFQNLR